MWIVPAMLLQFTRAGRARQFSRQRREAILLAFGASEILISFDKLRRCQAQCIGTIKWIPIMQQTSLGRNFVNLKLIDVPVLNISIRSVTQILNQMHYLWTICNTGRVAWFPKGIQQRKSCKQLRREESGQLHSFKCLDRGGSSQLYSWKGDIKLWQRPWSSSPDEDCESSGQVDIRNPGRRLNNSF